MAAEPPNEMAVVRDVEMYRYVARGWRYLGRYTHPGPDGSAADLERWRLMRDWVWLVR